MELHFGKKEKLPGSKMKVKVKADSGSLCSVSVVDKSVHIMGGTKQLTMAKVRRHINIIDIA